MHFIVSVEASSSQLLAFTIFIQEKTVFTYCSACLLLLENCSTYTQQLQFGWSPLLVTFWFLPYFCFLSEAGLVNSCLKKEGSSLPQVTEKQSGVILTESEMDLLPLSRHRDCYDWEASLRKDPETDQKRINIVAWKNLLWQNLFQYLPYHQLESLSSEFQGSIDFTLNCYFRLVNEVNLYL